MPWATLVFVLAGYSFFGTLLGVLSAPAIFWLLAWLGSVGWVLNEALIWFISLIGAIAPLQLHPQKFNFKQTIVIMAGLAGFGLIAGNFAQL